MDAPAPAPPAGRLWAWGALALLVLIWGTTWAAIRIGLEGIPPFTGVALRFALAGAVLAVAARALGVPLGGDRRARELWIVNGLLTFAVPYGVVYWAEQWVPSGLASVLFSTFPLFVAGLAHFWLPGERLSAASTTGILAGFAGVGVIFTQDLGALAGPGTVRAAVLFLLSPLAAAVANVVVKRRGHGLHALSITAVPMLLTAVLAGGAALIAERGRELRFDAVSVGALVYLALAGSAVTFWLYFWLLSKLRATGLSLITYGIPVVAVWVGTTFLGEPLTGRMVVGSLLVIAGVALAIRGARA